MSPQRDYGKILQRAFGSATAPQRITQEAYEGDPKHLRRLARLRSGDRAEVSDLWQYTQDLLYTEIQDSLLAHVLPFCLEAWEDLRGTRTEYGGFVEQFYPVLANMRFFERHMNPTQAQAVSEFMRSSILEEIEDQRGLTYSGSGTRPYRWIMALTTLGVLLPDIEPLWSDWWTVATVGRAVAAVQYLSCLIYPKSENPVFAPWNPESGGGPPCLWEFGGHLYAHRWLDENIRFLRRALNPHSAAEVLRGAVNCLVGHPEHELAAEIQSDLPLCTGTLAVRCAALPDLLGAVSEPGKLCEWPD